MKKHKTAFIVIAVIAIPVVLIWWGKTNQSVEMVSDDSDLVSMRGIHYHPELRIFVKGEQIEIPENIGLVGGHQPMHTHEDVPIVHLEYPAKVTKDDTRLGRFFEIWGKDFRSFGENVSMTVNGEINTEFENYLMKDKDVIELRYE
jgi:hypothetical protein